MNENERLRELRKALGQTQAAFGAKIGVGGSAVANLEAGTRQLTQATILAICRTNWDGRYVNEEWLRSGTGGMFQERDVEAELAVMLSELSDTPLDKFKRRLFATLATLDEDQWLTLAEIAERLADKPDNP